MHTHHRHLRTGVYAGTATVQFGGDNGISHKVGAGDTIIIPAGKMIIVMLFLMSLH